MATCNFCHRQHADTADLFERRGAPGKAGALRLSKHTSGMLHDALSGPFCGTWRVRRPS